MSYNIIPTPTFKKEAKKLSKRYASLKEDLTALNELLSKTPETGIPLGNNIYKIRIAIKSKGKGKSGGARVITYVIKNDKEVYLLTIYDKSEMDNIDDKSLKKIIKDITENKG
jgi:mRNA-degrading endonuclease RelE of RelBE toxin-antitoxin system